MAPRDGIPGGGAAHTLVNVGGALTRIATSGMFRFPMLTCTIYPSSEQAKKTPKPKTMHFFFYLGGFLW